MRKEELVGHLEKLYGLNKEKIDHQLKEIENAFYSDELRNHWEQLKSKLKPKMECSHRRRHPTH